MLISIFWEEGMIMNLFNNLFIFLVLDFINKGFK